MTSVTVPALPGRAGAETTTAAPAVATGSPYLGVAVATAVGALGGVLATWAIVVTQTLPMSL